ncbi:hypothetical protein AD935_01910 [Gluconobacter japonicus]|nr:hypothetical protein AD935_01910 [Gluconobacter japonicus]
MKWWDRRSVAGVTETHRKPQNQWVFRTLHMIEADHGKLQQIIKPVYSQVGLQLTPLFENRGRPHFSIKP